MPKDIKQITAGIVLAAGMSTRLGQNKQLVTVGNRPVIEWVLDAASHSALDKIFLVLGFEAQKTLQVLQHRLEQDGISVLINQSYADGMSSSLKAGLAAAAEFDGAMFLLGDQPLLETTCIDALLQAFRQSDALIAAPTCRGLRRNPVVFDKSLFPKIQAVTGDQGARQVLREHENETILIEFNEPALFLDVDTPEDVRVVNDCWNRRGVNRNR